MAILIESALLFTEDKAWSLYKTGCLLAWTFISMHITAEICRIASTCEKLEPLAVNHHSLSKPGELTGFMESEDLFLRV